MELVGLKFNIRKLKKVAPVCGVAGMPKQQGASSAFGR
jgi:hypothetical protein